MAFKFVVFAALAAVASAGLLPASYSSSPSVAYSSAPSVSYSSVSTPLVAAQLSHGPQLSYAAPAYKVAAPAYKVAAPAYKVAAPAYNYAAPAYKVAAPAYNYAAPAYKVAAPVAYSAPAYKVAAPVHYAAPVSHAVLAEPSAPAEYDFGYAVNDPHTGDNHSQHESRHGDAVQGSYSLIEADGSKRTVEYSADAHSGFNAVVHNEPAAVHVKAVAPVAKVVAAPLAHAYAAPAYYH